MVEKPLSYNLGRICPEPENFAEVRDSKRKRVNKHGECLCEQKMFAKVTQSRKE